MTAICSRVISSLPALCFVGISLSCAARIVTVDVDEMRALTKPSQQDTIAVLATVLESGDSLTFVDGSVLYSQDDSTLSGDLRDGGRARIKVTDIARVYLRTNKFRTGDYLFFVGLGAAAAALFVLVKLVGS
jgi:hypothetical protein